MPRITDQEGLRSSLIFGQGATTAKMSSIAKATKIPIATIYRDRRAADNIPLKRLQTYVAARGMTDEQIIKLIRGKA